MKKIFLIAMIFSTLSFLHVDAANNTFTVNKPDYSLSPYTGMTRQNWVDAAKYLLSGAFAHVKTLDDPMYFPHMGEVCYPKDESRVRGATLEGLCRTLFVAAPLLKEDSTLTINGIRLADYYRHQLALLVDTTSKQYISHRGNRGPCQDLVEFGALGISMFVCHDVVWKPLPQALKDSLESMMESYGDGPTIQQNWRFFNVFVMSFFKKEGYKINDALLEKYVNQLLDDYRGNGWYLDHPNYDYYSMWAYQLYGNMWSRFFGDKYYPELAAKFRRNFSDMYTSYPYLFGRDGKMIMWGRSNMYRFASSAPLPFGRDINYGWMRRIASGDLLQFLQNPQFLKDGVPTPGFYGLFDPVLQGYSCRGSVYWCAKAFLSLMLPANDPYWSAIENEGDWDKMEVDNVYNHYYPGPKILITNYPNSGASEVRAWCDYSTLGKWVEYFRGSECYNRLAYNSLFPWMADGKNGEVAMNYVVKNQKGEWEPLRRYTIKGFDDGIFRRTVWLQSDSTFRMSLTDKPIANGIIRTDEVISCNHPTQIRLGHYALPEKQVAITRRVVSLKKHHMAYLINNGEYELAMIPVSGWDSLQFVRATDLHPEAKVCEVIDAVATVPVVTSSLPKSFVTVQLFKKGDFTLRELTSAIAPYLETAKKK
jgi:hypothetical protein